MSLGMFSYKRLDTEFGRYKDKLCEFLEKSERFDVIRSDENPITFKKAEKEKICESEKVILSSDRLIFGEFGIGLGSNLVQNNLVYMSKRDMLIAVPRGYKGAFTYYRFVPCV